MAYEILMPQMGLTMEEGTVSAWLKKEGDAIKVGDEVLEITTDKLTNAYVSEYEGVLLKIVAQEGEDIPVKGLLGYIGQPGEAVGGAAAPAPKAEEPKTAPAAKPVTATVAVTGQRIRISPLARKVAAELGIDPSGIVGSGPSGRIRRQDVLAYAAAKPKAAAPAPAPVMDAEGLMEGDTVAKMAPMRRVVSQRMLQSHTEIPPVTQVTKVDVTELMQLRKDILEKAGKKYSVNDFLLAAVAKTLRAHPEMLVSYAEGQVIQRAHVNLGVAVALEGGLIVPVIRDADTLTLDQVAAAAKDLAGRAKSNQLKADEYKGSTFSVTNLGMFGVESFTPIVNQPDAAILGVGCIDNELQMDDEGKLSRHQVMRLSLTYDHRLIDGAVAARFAADLRDMLQAPIRILL